MELPEKAKLICQFFNEYKNDDRYKVLFTTNKFGFLIARQNYCNEALSNTESGLIDKFNSLECADWICSTWSNLCLAIGNADPNESYADLEQLLASVSADAASSFSPSFQELASEALSSSDVFRKGQLLNKTDVELQIQIDEFVKHGEIFSESQRFLLYGSLAGLENQSSLANSLINYLENKSDLDAEEQDRLNLISFLLHYAVKTLTAQNAYPEELLESMQQIDFENPLIQQLTNDQWQIDQTRLKLPSNYISNFSAMIEMCKTYLYGATSSYDFGMEPQCCETKLVGIDVIELTEQPGYIEGLEFSDYATFVWSAYWYPKFLLLAYANPSNVFIEQVDNHEEVQWCSGWDDPIGIAPAIPRGMAQILRLTPRILTLLATSQISEHFDEIPDNFVNLFPALRHTRPEASTTARDDVVREYLDRALDDEDQGLDFFLDEEQDMTLFFEIISASLYTNNVKLLEELAELEDELTKKCLLLNPATPESVLEKLGAIEFELSEQIEFDTGYFEDSKYSDVDSFAEFMAAVASNCKDVEFANSIESRLESHTEKSEEA